MKTTFLLGCIAMMAAACSGRTLDVGYTDAGGADPGPTHGDDDSGVKSVEVDAGPSPSPSPPEPLQLEDPIPPRSEAEALAVCGESTHGPVDLYASPAALTAKIARKWFSCDHNDGTNSVFHNEIGIEFTTDGQWFHLAKNAQGGFERLVGADHQGTWDVFRGDGTTFQPTDTTPGTYTYVYMRWASNAFSPTNMVLEKTPRRLKTSEMGAGVTTVTWLVPLN